VNDPGFGDVKEIQQLVHHCGGLVKVVDKRHGIPYRGGAEALATAIKRALVLYRQPGGAELSQMQRSVPPVDFPQNRKDWGNKNDF
jgi:hypothetical protein